MVQYLEELQVKIRYVVGKENVVADYLSRNIKDELPWSVISCNTIELSQQLYTNSEFIAFQCQDSKLSQIFNFLEKNEEDRDLNGIATDYRRFIHRISIQDNLFVLNDRGNIIVIVPQTLREEVLRYYIVTGHLVTLAFSRLIAVLWKGFGGLNSTDMLKHLSPRVNFVKRQKPVVNFMVKWQYDRVPVVHLSLFQLTLLLICQLLYVGINIS